MNMNSIQPEGYIPQRGSRTLVVKVLGTEGNAKMDIAGPNDAYMDVFNPATQDTARVPLMAKVGDGTHPAL